MSILARVFLIFQTLQEFYPQDYRFSDSRHCEARSKVLFAFFRMLSLRGLSQLSFGSRLTGWPFLVPVSFNFLGLFQERVEPKSYTRNLKVLISAMQFLRVTIYTRNGPKKWIQV